MTARYVDLNQVSPQKGTDGGSRIAVTKLNFPELKGMSFYYLTLQPEGVREVHWHAKAQEHATLPSNFPMKSLKTLLYLLPWECFLMLF
jgi:hypothetical protein